MNVSARSFLMGGIAVVCASPGDTAADLPVLRDPDGAVSKRLSVDQLPSVVIIDKQGNVAATIGGMDPTVDLAKQLAERLSKIL